MAYKMMRNSIYLMAMCLLWIYQLVVAETNEPRSYTALSSALQTNSNSALVCQVFGTITSDTTWDPAICDSYVVTDDVTIIRPLVIKPGTLIRFDNQKTLTIRSKLIARGTEARPIIFTSNVGQNKGDWGYISFTDSSIDAQFDVAGNFIEDIHVCNDLGLKKSFFFWTAKVPKNKYFFNRWHVSI